MKVEIKNAILEMLSYDALVEQESYYTPDADLHPHWKKVLALFGYRTLGLQNLFC